MKISRTRKVLVSSFIAILFSILTFTFTTFAWFSDSISSSENIITMGNLDVEMYWSNDLENGNWNNIEDPSKNTVFSHGNYEPGYTDVKYLKIVNAGSLAFKYDVSLLPAGEIGELAEVVDLYYLYDAKYNISSRSLTEMEKLGTIKNILGKSITNTQVLLPKYVNDGTHISSEVIIAVALKMQTSAGNEYKGKSLGDGFSIRLVATQYSFEGDSFGKDFDDALNWPNDSIVGDHVTSLPVESTTDNKVAKEVKIANKKGNVNAVIPAGVLLDKGTNSLTLSVAEVEESKANVTLNEAEAMLSMDVHIGGVSKDNNVVIAIAIDELLPKGLNLGNYKFYHVEGDETIQMTLLTGEATPVHNSFSYDPITGNVVVYLKSFSEVSVVADTEMKWEGGVDYSWYSKDATEYLIANGDQLNGLAKIVGGMAEGIDYDDFICRDEKGEIKVDKDGKTVRKVIKLVSDINLADKDNASSYIFYPIGYHYDEKTGKPYSTVYQFSGVFDGNGHTIANFYQNTWEIKGDYDANYYKDAMGLFGYIVDGEVANLRVDSFSSDGEFTPTGVIAAYAENSTFLNISIVNCNPRVYNTGNGGIVGVAGNSGDTTDKKLVFTNITVDNSNKISALWGSWDVACGGLMGMFRGNGLVDMKNCHVAAQIDVYNDVCGNYQYYWYRYAGMIIGSIRGKNIVDDKGYTVPNTAGITATDCTVHFGDWNDYYYCELVANSLASYTHDHQFSRLTEVKSVNLENKIITPLEGEAYPVPTSGRYNYVVVTEKDETKKVTCYHFVNGEVWDHEDAGTETVDGKTVLKEDKQVVYLPFKQIIQGDGWGVKHLPVYDDGKTDFAGITILDREYDAQSYDKFEKVGNRYYFAPDEEVKVCDLFKAVEVPTTGMYPINDETVKITVSPADEYSTVTFVHTNNPNDWTKGTLKLIGEGKAIITISDYTFCNPTTYEVEVKMLDKFEATTKTEFDYGSVVKLGDLFTATEFKDYIGDKIILTINGKEEEFDSTGWSNKEITLNTVGEITISIKDDTKYCNEETIMITVNSIDKFESIAENKEFNAGETISINEIFKVTGDLNTNSNVVIEIDFEDNSYIDKKYEVKNWADVQLELNGVGAAVIKIYEDDDSCNPTTCNINLVKWDKFVPTDETEFDACESVVISDLFKTESKNVSTVNATIDFADVNYKDIIFENLPLDKEIQLLGVGAATITILDAYSNAAVIRINLERQTEKFKSKFTNDFVYRIGNQNAVSLDSLFTKIDEIDEVILESENIEESNASVVYNASSNNLQFSGLGKIKVEISDKYSTPLELVLEVVDAVNATSATNVKSNNVVLLNDCGFSSLEVSGGYTLYGNGFTMTCGSDSPALDMGYSFVTLNNGTLDNVQIVTPNFDYAVLYKSNMTESGNRSETTDRTRYYNVKSGVMVSGNSQILNSRISGGRAAVNVTGGNAVIDNSRIELGAVASLLIGAANSVTLRDVTLVQKPTASTYDSSKTLMGFSTLFVCDANGKAAPVTLEGTLVQNAWVDESDKQYVPSAGQSIISTVLGKTEYLHDTDGDGTKESLNLGFAYMPESLTSKVKTTTITDNRTNKNDVPYDYAEVSILNGKTYVYSYKNTNGTTDSFKTESEYIPNKYGDIITVNYSDIKDGLEQSKSFETDDWVYELNVDLDKLSGYALDFNKLSMSINGVTVTDYKVNGNAKPTSPEAVTAGGTIYTLTATVKGKEYTATYKVTGTETSKESPSLVAANYEKGLCVASSYGGTWHGAAPALEGIQIKYWSVAEQQYMTINLSDYTPTTKGQFNGTNTTWTYSPANGDFTLTLTGGQVHSSNNVYAMPVVCEGKLYFVAAKSSGLVNSGNSARTIPVSYTFKDNNNGEVLTFSHTWSVAENKNAQYKYSDFCNGTLTQLKTSSSGGDTCLAEGTLITMNDGTKRAVEDLRKGDLVMAFDHLTGEVTFNKVIIVVKTQSDYYKNTFVFDDGTELVTINEHGIYDLDLNKYVNIDHLNYLDYLGHRFVSIDVNGNISSKVLVDVKSIYESGYKYDIVTNETLNYVAEDTLSVTHVLVDVINTFEFDQNMKYDQEKMMEDINKYGLYEYDEWSEYCDIKVFEEYNIPVMKVGISKGLYTKEYIISLINTFVLDDSVQIISE